MGESFLERLFTVFVEGPGAILNARFGWGDASRATVVALSLLLRFEGRAV